MSKELINISQVAKDLDLGQKIETFNQLMNTAPKAEWIKKHPFVKKKGQNIDYMPVRVARNLLRSIYPQSKIEILKSQVVFNSVEVTVRVHYLHPVSGEWLFVDGIGAAPLQTDKGAKSMDAMSMKTDAVQKASPSAKSYAIKDALGELGEIFGSGLNDDTEMDFEPVYSEPKPDLSKDKAKAELDKIKKVEDLQPLYDRLATDFTMSYEIDEMFKFRYETISVFTPPKAKPQPKKEPQAPIINDLAKSDEERIKKALSKVYKASEINDVYAKMQSEGVNVKAFTNLFTEYYKKLSNETA